jgi:toxin-antitoxin system PIN domain toxin
VRALLDVNVLIALFDADHVFNLRAHEWLAENAALGIATCPLTENGLIRILSHPSYSATMRLLPNEVIRRLGLFTANHNHVFWPDSVSFRDSGLFTAEYILGSKQLTDLYLLALAADSGGRLVTFDGGIPLNAVPSSSTRHLEVI